MPKCLIGDQSLYHQYISKPKSIVSLSMRASDASIDRSRSRSRKTSAIKSYSLVSLPPISCQNLVALKISQSEEILGIFRSLTTSATSKTLKLIVVKALKLLQIISKDVLLSLVRCFYKSEWI